MQHSAPVHPTRCTGIGAPHLSPIQHKHMRLDLSIAGCATGASHYLSLPPALARGTRDIPACNISNSNWARFSQGELSFVSQPPPESSADDWTFRTAAFGTRPGEQLAPRTVALRRGFACSVERRCRRLLLSPSPAAPHHPHHPHPHHPHHPQEGEWPAQLRHQGAVPDDNRQLLPAREAPELPQEWRWPGADLRP